jgi:hypothetical protein
MEKYRACGTRYVISINSGGGHRRAKKNPA